MGLWFQISIVAFISKISSTILRPHNAIINDIASFFDSKIVIFLHTEEEILGRYVQIQKEFSLKYRYYSAVYNSEDFLIEGINPRLNKMLVVVLEQPNVLKHIEMLSKRINMALYEWLIFRKNFEISDYMGIRVPFNCEFVISYERSNEIFNLIEIYQLTSSSNLSSNFLGSWGRQNGIKASTTYLHERRNNLQGAVIRAGVFHYLDRCATGVFVSVVMAHCLYWSFWEMVAESINATTEGVLVEPDADLIKFIEDFDINVIVSSYILTPTDNKYSIFWPLVISRLEIYTKYGGRSLNWKTYIQPFESSIWVMILIWITLSSLLLILLKWLDKRNRFLEDKMEVSVWCSLYAVLNQGSSEMPSKIYQRIIFFMLFLVPTILNPGYNAGVTSFLTLQTPVIPFTDLEGLLNTKTYKLLSFSKDFSLHQVLERDGSPLAKKLLKYSTVNKEMQPEDESEGAKRMCSSEVSLLNHVYSMRAVKPKCQYYKLDRPFLTVFDALRMRKDSEYKFLYDPYALQIRFTGVLQTLKNHLVSKFFLEEYPMNEETYVPVQFENIILLIALVGLGFGISIVICFLEIMHHKKIRRKQ